jgi:hypothetical protein
MGETSLSIIPTVPDWTPDGEAAAAAMDVLRELCPKAAEVGARWHEEVRFIDQGENFECVRCPACDTELERGWWIEQMDLAYLTRFTDLSTRTPCCHTATSLNDLRYDWPAGFATFEITARDPDRGPLTSAEIARISDTLGHPTRAVISHY